MNFYKRYPADYGRKTSRLTLMQHGAYTLLLDELYATESPLPADMSALNRVCRAMSRPEQDAVRSVAEQFFPIGEDGLRRNRRATEELIEAAPAVEAARLNGKKGGRPKKYPQQKPTGFSEQNPNETQSEPRSKPPHSSDNSPSLRSGEIAGVPELVAAGFDEQTAAEFIACKAKRKAPLTIRAWKDHLREAGKAGWTPMAAAEKVMAKTWKGFEAKYVADESKSDSSPMSFYERDIAAKTARVHEITGGLASAKPAVRRPDVLQEVFDATPSLRLG